MSKPFDAASKHIVDPHAGDWLALGGLPAGTTSEVVDSDLSAVSSAADKLIRVAAPDPYIAHLEFQTGPDPELDERVLVYKVLARRKLKLPVMSVVFLLRTQALTRGVTGRVTERLSPDQFLNFGYKLVRVWELPPKIILAGGIGTLPLAPISDIAESELPGVIEQMRRRLGTEVSPGEAGEIWAAAEILMGLRYSEVTVAQLTRGVQGMEESTTYQAIIRKGRIEGVCADLLRRGTNRFGPPNEEIRARLEAVSDIHRLEKLSDVLDGSAAGWNDLLRALQ